MNMGLCVALGRAFNLYSGILEKLTLESTGTNDEMLSTLLHGLLEQENFKAFIYKKLPLDKLSIDCIIKMILRPIP